MLGLFQTMLPQPSGRRLLHLQKGFLPLDDFIVEIFFGVYRFHDKLFDP